MTSSELELNEASILEATAHVEAHKASIAAGLKMAIGSGSSPGRPGSALRTGRDRPRCFSANAAQRAREAGFVSAGVGAGVSAGGVDIDDLDSP